MRIVSVCVVLCIFLKKIIISQFPISHARMLMLLTWQMLRPPALVPPKKRHRLLQELFAVSTPAAASLQEPGEIPSPHVSSISRGFASSREKARYVGPAYPRPSCAPPQPPRAIARNAGEEERERKLGPPEVGEVGLYQI
jgi:hypothetical protein